jgi:hypothetical protein
MKLLHPRLRLVPDVRFPAVRASDAVIGHLGRFKGLLVHGDAGGNLLTGFGALDHDHWHIGFSGIGDRVFLPLGIPRENMLCASAPGFLLGFTPRSRLARTAVRE